MSDYKNLKVEINKEQPLDEVVGGVGAVGVSNKRLA